MSYTLAPVFFIFLLLTQNIGCNAECHCGKQSNARDSDTGDELLMTGIKTVGVAGVAVVAAPFVLTGLGFGAGGIAAGSLAASFQSAWFGGTISGITGAVFSALQSMGAVGVGLTGKAAVLSSTGTVVKVFDALTGEKCDC